MTPKRENGPTALEQNLVQREGGNMTKNTELFKEMAGMHAAIRKMESLVKQIDAEHNAAVALIDQIRDEIEGDATAYDIHKLLLKAGRATP